jgi:hypothetical protein
VGAVAGVGFLLTLVGIGLCFVSLVVGMFAVIAGIVIVLVGRFT